jgi:hypothetical protein
MQFLKTYEEFTRKREAFVLRVERDYSVMPKHFPDSKFLSFYVRIFLDVDTSISASQRMSALPTPPQYYTLDDVKLVKYELHPSYYERTRVAENPVNNFEAKVWTYGFYPIQALVLLKFGQTIIVKGNVEFPVSPEEKAMNRNELEKPVMAG